MESFVGSIGLLRDQSSLPVRWLLRKRSRLKSIQAERLEGDSYRDCIQREVAWTLNLHRDQDCLVSSHSRLHLSQAIFVPDESQEVWFEVEFFVVELFTEAARQTVANPPDVVWLTGEEVHAGQSKTGLPICERHRLLMAAADVIPAW